MLGAGYFSPLPGYMNIDDAIMVAEENAYNCRPVLAGALCEHEYGYFGD